MDKVKCNAATADDSAAAAEELNGQPKLWSNPGPTCCDSWEASVNQLLSFRRLTTGTASTATRPCPRNRLPRQPQGTGTATLTPCQTHPRRRNAGAKMPQDRAFTNCGTQPASVNLIIYYPFKLCRMSCASQTIASSSERCLA
jgi:hypothetical protein